jgi:hypothetical protein
MREDKLQFTIGSSKQYVKVTPLFRSQNDCYDYWDGNWVDSDIEISIGGFKGKFIANLRTDEYSRFHKQLVNLKSNLYGKASFDSIEHWLSLNISGDGLGHLKVECEAMDDAGIGNTLRFNLEIDQTEIDCITKNIEKILKKFPIRGTPSD